MNDISASIEDAIHSNQTTRLIRIKEVCNLTGISRSHIYLLASTGQFPKSVELIPGGAARAWVEQEVHDWINQRVAARNEDV
jgi:prophage regulatory protein